VTEAFVRPKCILNFFEMPLVVQNETFETVEQTLKLPAQSRKCQAVPESGQESTRFLPGTIASK
jgi:hypothetical protein